MKKESMRIPVIPHNSIDSLISMMPIVSHQIKKNGFSALRKIPAKNWFLLGFFLFENSY